MKKILSLVLAVMMLFGCLSITALAAEDETNNTTTITANVGKPELEYVIIIPDAVTMNEAGVKEIGAAKIDTAEGKLKNATAKTVISYTASGTDFKLKTDTSKNMTATYYSAYTDASTNTVLDSTKAIEVYKNSALVDPLTKLYVGVAQTDWDTTATNNPGTYTATVTYNFSAEEVEPISAAEALTTGAQYNLKYLYDYDDAWYSITFKKTADGFELVKVLKDDAEQSVEYYASIFSSTVEDSKIIFKLGEVITFTLDTNTNKYTITGSSADELLSPSFSVKPADATEFTNVAITPAD